MADGNGGIQYYVAAAVMAVIIDGGDNVK